MLFHQRFIQLKVAREGFITEEGEKDRRMKDAESGSASVRRLPSTSPEWIAVTGRQNSLADSITFVNRPLAQDG
jgi:hypothetical protein